MYKPNRKNKRWRKNKHKHKHKPKPNPQRKEVMNKTEKGDQGKSAPFVDIPFEPLELKRRCYMSIEQYVKEFETKGALVVPAKKDATVPTNTGKLEKFYGWEGWRGGGYDGYGGYGHSPEGMYIYQDNGADVLAVCHVDTVCERKHFYDCDLGVQHVIFNPGLDDRLGAYTIIDLLPKLGVHVDLLITEDEEVGATTAERFMDEQVKNLKHYNWIVEFDRRGDDVVTYNFNNQKCEDLLRECGFKIGVGSFTDITCMTQLGVMGMNFGVSYDDNCHNEKCMMTVPDYIRSMQKFMHFWEQAKDVKYPNEYTTPTYTTTYAASSTSYDIKRTAPSSWKAVPKSEIKLYPPPPKPKSAWESYEKVIEAGKKEVEEEEEEEAEESDRSSMHSVYCPECHVWVNEDGLMFIKDPVTEEVYDGCPMCGLGYTLEWDRKHTLT